MSFYEMTRDGNFIFAASAISLSLQLAKVGYKGSGWLKVGIGMGSGLNGGVGFS